MIIKPPCPGRVIAALAVLALAGELRAGNVGIVEGVEDLVAFWTFGEAAGVPKVARSGLFPLADGNATMAGRVAGGPFSGFSAVFNGSNTFLTLPNASLGGLNISGPDAAVTVVAWIKRDDTNVGFLAGIWQEDNNDPRRQYGLFLDLPVYGGGGNVCGHVSWTGGPSPKFPGSPELLPFSRDYSANRSTVLNGRWTTVAFTYDGEMARSYIDGKFEARSSYTEPGPPNGYGLTYAKNPYAFPPGLGNNGGNFTVGAVRLTGGMSNHYKGEIGGLAVFDRAATPEEIFRLHAAMLDDGQPVADYGFRNAGSALAAVSTAVWRAFRNAATDATGNTSNGWAVGGSPGMGSENGYLAKNLTGEPGIAWTDAVPAVPTTVLERIEFRLNNSNDADLIRIAVKVGGRWFVTGQMFKMGVNGNTQNQWNLSELKSFAWTRDAAAWRVLDFNQSNALSVGAAPLEDLSSGGIEAVGFHQAANSGTLRVDDLRLYVDAGDLADSHKAGWRWQAEHFDRAERGNALLSGPLADADGDGRVNLLERAFGTHPRKVEMESRLPVAGETAGRLSLVYEPVDDALVYAAEVADDLAGPWRSGNDFIEILTHPEPGKVIAADRALISDSPRRFMRLRVIDPGE